ncbi:MAG TPA: nuclear transport factor 2 family protein [Candidatus Angelobacter sp.]|jgi:ketosteroid isomerase-like protein
MVATNPLVHLTKVEVESAVRAYWKALSAKDVVQQQNFYDDHAGIFATDSNKLERARLVLLRRQREYLNAATKTTVQVGEIDVELIGPNHALALYTIRLDAKHVTKTSSIGSSLSEEHLENARVTHVFERQSDGALRIVHEHISVPRT